MTEIRHLLATVKSYSIPLRYVQEFNLGPPEPQPGYDPAYSNLFILKPTLNSNFALVNSTSRPTTNTLLYCSAETRTKEV
ncbi:MAG: hypothetical protein OES26_06675 [Gammaproteobacteria bacterium]|nr:hypothetical protein [Gammaproteobacteria bacterium]